MLTISQKATYVNGMMICPIDNTALVGAVCPVCGLRWDIDSESSAPIYLRARSVPVGIGNKNHSLGIYSRQYSGT